MSESTLNAQYAAHMSWAATVDRSARTAPARNGLLARFERLADPEGVLPPEIRAQRADALRKAHYKKMALKSAQARRRRKSNE